MELATSDISCVVGKDCELSLLELHIGNRYVVVVDRNQIFESSCMEEARCWQEIELHFERVATSSFCLDLIA